MIKRLALLFLIIPFYLIGFSQIGLTTFIPTGGNFAFPSAPFTFSKPLRLKSFPILSIIPSISTYSIGGMMVKGIPEGFEANKPLIGGFTSILGSVSPAFTIPVIKKALNIDLYGGVFIAYNVAPVILDGNFNRMLAKKEGWDACSSDFTFNNDPPLGYVVGINFNIHINDAISLSPGVSFYQGISHLDLKGTYCGGAIGSQVSSKSASFPDSYLFYQGFAIQLYVQIRNIKDYTDLYNSMFKYLNNYF